jgi:hypothetical protein
VRVRFHRQYLNAGSLRLSAGPLPHELYDLTRNAAHHDIWGVVLDVFRLTALDQRSLPSLPCRSPHVTHASAIRRTLPMASGGTGFCSVIDSKADDGPLIGLATQFVQDQRDNLRTKAVKVARPRGCNLRDLRRPRRPVQSSNGLSLSPAHDPFDSQLIGYARGIQTPRESRHPQTRNCDPMN